MRADRLLLLLTLLQMRGPLTTARLAEELEVSRRTVIRDLYALRAAGFPVNTAHGPRGGCSLDDDFRNRLLSLSQAELSALFMMNVPAPLVELGVAGDLKGALLKLAASLPAAKSGIEERVRQRILLDSVPWSAARESVQYLSVLHRAVLEDRWVDVILDRAFHIQSARRMAPYGLVAKATTWYVVWAGEDGRLRVDRVARVLNAELQKSTFVRLPEFDLATFWADWCRRQAVSEPRFEVTAFVSPEALATLDAAVRLKERSAPKGDTARARRRHLVRLAFSSIDDARSQLLAYGGSVEVIEPLALRLTLADFAEQALRVYET